MNTKKLFLCFILILIIPLHSQAQEALNGIFPANKNPRAFSGIAIVTKGDNKIFSHSDSLSVDGKKQNMNSKTKFVIGSLSKQITAALVLREIEQGRLKLDNSISIYLPTLTKEWNKRVTIKHLLSHTSGIDGLTDDLNSEPGQVFAYSNLGYNVLGEIVAVTSGEPYSSLVGTLFELCDMNNSFAPREHGQDDKLAIDGFNEDEAGTIRLVTSNIPYSSVPSGGIISTANDLLKWNQCLHKGKILPLSMHKKMVTKYFNRPHRWENMGYGFGLQISNDLDIKEWSHSGYVSGYISTMAYYPESDISLVILENISWNAKNINRVFYYHDKLREELIKIVGGDA